MNYNEKTERTKAGLRRVKNDEDDMEDEDAKSKDFSDFDSEASRVNYWKEISKEEHKTRFQFIAPGQMQQFMGGTQSPNGANSPSKGSNGGNPGESQGNGS